MTPDFLVEMPQVAYGVVKAREGKRTLVELALEPTLAVERKSTLDALTPRGEGAVFFVCTIGLTYGDEFPPVKKRIKP